MTHAVVLVAVGNRDEARTIAAALVEERLAACVQLLPIESLYVWEGKVVDDAEILLLVKTRVDAFERVRARVRELHSYEVPEIVMLDVAAGDQPYLDWIDGLVPARGSRS
jgi:periplasmic divalent cation tolerance protein